MYNTYAVIVIGSKNILMRIYELTSSKEIRLLDNVCHEYDLGNEAYLTRVITFDQIEAITEVLQDFKLHMKEYGVEEYVCYATSAIRNAKNRYAVLNHIKIRTGCEIQILSNSEIRFLIYKGMQISGLDIDKIIQNNTAIVDIGSGSVQVSLFDKQALYMTQNLDIGTAKIREMLEVVENNVLHYISIMEEYIEYEIVSFKNGFLKDKAIKNVIAVGDEIKNLNRIAPELELSDKINYDQILYLFKKVKKATHKDLMIQYGLSIEEARVLLPTVIIYKKFLELSKADTIYICEVNLCEGGVVDYAERKKKITMEHDYYQDIIASVKYIGKRYRYSKDHAQYVSDIALQIFDRTQKFHGLDKRDRLLLEIAAILHDIGKYVNLNDPGKNGYQLILSTEIMGISHREREEIANIVLYNTQELPDINVMDTYFWRDGYLRIAKMSAILRLANALDRGHKQKYQKINIARKKKELLITVESDQDITLEISLFQKKAEYFSSIFGIVPVMRQKIVL